MASLDDEVAYFLESARREINSKSAQGDPSASLKFHQSNALITPERDEDYPIPPAFRRMLTPQLLGRLSELYLRLRALRQEMVGLCTLEALALYNGDEVVVALALDFRDWMIDASRYRLTRNAARFGDRPVLACANVALDFIDWFDQLRERPGAGHHVVLEGISPQVQWFVFMETLAPELRLSMNAWGEYEWSIDHLPPVEQEYCEAILKLYRVSQMGSVAWLRAFLNFEAPKNLDVAAMRKELHAIALDISEARPLLMRAYNPLDHVVQICPDFFVTWDWAQRHFLGKLLCSHSADLMAECCKAGKYHQIMRVTHQGELRDHEGFWRPYGDDCLPSMLRVLRPIHEKLISAWLAVQRPDLPSADPEDEMSLTELVARGCERLTQGESTAQHRVPAVRMQALLNLLERHLGCEVAQGKGSEITVYRPGGRKFILGNHRRNPHVPAHLIRALLRRVGIGAAEWAKAACL